jgi:hypothetical protein
VPLSLTDVVCGVKALVGVSSHDLVGVRCCTLWLTSCLGGVLAYAVDEALENVRGTPGGAYCVDRASIRGLGASQP